MIEFLSSVEGEYECLVDGYEGGLEIVNKENIELVEYHKNANQRSYFGEYEVVDKYYKKVNSKMGIVFSRKS